MRILLAVCSMIERSGAEWFVHDLAVALNAQRHNVILYAPIMGDMVDNLRYLSIACVTDLNLIASEPDIIIGNTYTETVLCLAQFPNVPLISVCHDRSAAHGQPPLFSRIRQYVAVDANCAERLMLEHGIPESRINIIYNGVDLRRFKSRSPLPSKPVRAAVFSNYASDSKETQAIYSSCSRLNIELTLIGERANNQARAPENLLGEFDLVFAKARCAMEAMVVGCAVILLNQGMGMAGMVTPANMREWHTWNFGRKLLQDPIEPKRLSQAIQEYSAKKAAEVSAYIRHYGSLDTTVSAFLKLVQTVLAEEALLERVHPNEEQREFACFLKESGGFIKKSSQHIKHLNQLINQQQQQLEQQQQLVEQQKKKLNLQQRQLQRRGRELEQQHQQLEIQKQVLSEKEHTLQLIQNSSSWRFTAPLRKIKNFNWIKQP